MDISADGDGDGHSSYLVWTFAPPSHYHQDESGKTALWAFGLTDEVFAATTSKLMRDNRRWSENWMIGIALCSWLSWVFGTAVGALFGNGPLKAYPAIEASLTFMLPALFLSFY